VVVEAVVMDEDATMDQDQTEGSQTVPSQTEGFQTTTYQTEVIQATTGLADLSHTESHQDSLPTMTTDQVKVISMEGLATHKRSLFAKGKVLPFCRLCGSFNSGVESRCYKDECSQNI